MAFAKWIGAFLGLLSGGAFGAIAGYALGYIVDDFISNGNQLTSGEQEPFSQQRRTTYTRRTTQSQRGTQQEGERNSYLFSLLLLSSHIIMADQKIMHSEMEYVRRTLRNNFGADAENARRKSEGDIRISTERLKRIAGCAKLEHGARCKRQARGRRESMREANLARRHGKSGWQIGLQQGAATGLGESGACTIGEDAHVERGAELCALRPLE